MDFLKQFIIKNNFKSSFFRKEISYWGLPHKYNFYVPSNYISNTLPIYMSISNQLLIVCMTFQDDLFLNIYNNFPNPWKDIAFNRDLIECIYYTIFHQDKNLIHEIWGNSCKDFESKDNFIIPDHFKNSIKKCDFIILFVFKWSLHDLILEMSPPKFLKIN